MKKPLAEGVIEFLRKLDTSGLCKFYLSPKDAEEYEDCAVLVEMPAEPKIPMRDLIHDYGFSVYGWADDHSSVLYTSEPRRS